MSYLITNMSTVLTTMYRENLELEPMGRIIPLDPLLSCRLLMLIFPYNTQIKKRTQII